MNLAKIRLWPYFAISTTLLLLAPVGAPSAKLSFLIPCLVTLFYQKPLIVCLWSAFAFGLLLDILSSSAFLGLHVTSFCAATAIIYQQKRHFFADNLSTLPILTFLTSALATAVQVVLIYIFQKEVVLGLKWFITNILLMPLFDSAYAFILFLLPSLVFGKPRRRGGDFFLNSSNMD